MFIAVLLTIAKYGSSPSIHQLDDWIKKLWDIYTVWYYSAIKKKENFALCNCMDGPREQYAKWNKPVGERHTIWFHSSVESNEQTE